MLAVGRALMSGRASCCSTSPRSALRPRSSRRSSRSSTALRERGLTILLVEQDAKLALKHADRGYVMRTGSVALAGTAAELLGNDRRAADLPRRVAQTRR